MNQEIPKLLRNALARQAVGDVHPSPDVLTSFMERTLAPMESEVVTHHLAQCAECREIVFLASDAAQDQDEVRDGRELVAAAAAPRVAPMPVYAASSFPVAARAETPRSRWTIRTRWALSIAAAVVLVSAGMVLQFSRARNRYQAAPLTVASNRPGPASPEARQDAIATNSQEAAALPTVPEMFAKAAPPPTTAARAKKVPAQTTVARNAADQFVPAPAVEVGPKARSSEATARAAGDIASAMVPEVRPQSTFAESEAAPAVQRAAPLAFGKAQTGMQSVSTVRPQWRIGPNGQLERAMAADQWTRVLDDQPITFRAAAVIASDVWAGGNGGALFHSSDGGEHWSKISLAANSNVETGAIVSIRFDDSQHGVVTSDGGTRWATTDGGVTWTTQ
jgi:hypothetical protein